MADLLLVLALLSKIFGVVFLFAAALGVFRFADPLQRMHAATKAGTVGALFVVLGVILSMQRTDATIIGILAIMFLLLTIPVAGHLLGRAVYVSGASIVGLSGEDALEGVLERRDRSLEERMDVKAETVPGVVEEAERPG